MADEGMQSLAPDTAFEHFAAYSVLTPKLFEKLTLDDVSVGDDSTPGIDTVAKPEQFTITVTGHASDGTELSDTFVSRFEDIRHTRASDGSLESVAEQLKHLLTEARALNRAVERVADAAEQDDDEPLS